ncbi:flavin-dependent oxidoreductase [Variovorax paradoxus]|nr:flavin-dependent oxidoreductase [Variovorax paradoxus]
MEVIIVGAGIGGLSAALSLHAAGIPVKVYEAAPRIEAMGLGIHLQPNAVRELTELGLGQALMAISVGIEKLGFYSIHGKQISTEPRGTAAGYRWPQCAVHRGDLQVLLLKAARERIGEQNIVTSHRLIDFEQEEGGVTLHFVNSETRERLAPVKGSILVAADGLHSVVRKHFYPEQGLRFGGQLMWRTAVPVKAWLGGKTMTMIGHRNQKLVAYPIRALPQGQVLGNFIFELGESGDGPPREEWNRKIDKAKFAQAFADWKFDWLDVPSLIQAADSIFEFPKMDRDPVERWSFGRVTLLGDAAHPMHPVGSQAGSQAVVDGRVLAKHLADHPDRPEFALQEYEAERLPPMRDICLSNRNLSHEIIMDVVYERAPEGFSNIDDVIPAAEIAQRAEAFRTRAGFDVTSLNARESYSRHQGCPVLRA